MEKNSLPELMGDGRLNSSEHQYKNKEEKHKGNGKVVYGQEPPSGESTTTECGFNYQLLAVITEVTQWGAPSCSQPQLGTDNGVRDGRSN